MTEKPENDQQARFSPWALLPLALLVPLLLIQVTMFLISTNDPGFAVEENYYAKATAWDQHMAQQRTNRELGWQLKLELVPATAGPQPQPLKLRATLADKTGEPVSHGRVNAMAFHNARAANRQRLVLEETAAGVYETPMVMQRAGLWEIRSDVQQAGRRFTQKEFIEVRASWLKPDPAARGAIR